MATAFMTTAGGDMENIVGDEKSRPKLQSFVSIIVDNVDETNSPSNGTTSFIQFRLNGAGIHDHVTNDSDDDSPNSPNSPHSPHSPKSDYEANLQKIKDEIVQRRNEFARLLDEHEQVVRELRRIESSGELQTLQQTTSEQQ